MTWAPLATSPEQDAALSAALQHDASLGERGVAILDLDGCLFDNRPRQVQIAREFAEVVGDPRIAAVTVDCFQTWDKRDTLRRAGLPEADAERLGRELFKYWLPRFFDDAYQRHDHALPGAPAFVRALAATGCRIVYLTGRYATMRSETERSFARWGFPWPAPLVLKADPAETDRDYKRRAVARIATWGTVAVCADNEPAQIVDMQRACPDAVCLWPDTDHSPGAASPEPPVRRIRGWLRAGARR